MIEDLTILFYRQSLFKTLSNLYNAKENCNQEHRSCVAIAMLSYEHYILYILYVYMHMYILGFSLSRSCSIFSIQG